MKLTRREVGLGLASFAATRCIAGYLPNPSPREFPLGVASADPQPGGAVLWTRYDGDEALVALVWPEAAEGAPIEVPAAGRFALAEVTGLQPSTWYRFMFRAGSARSTEGRFRTAPAPGTRPLVRLGATSCTKDGFPFDVLSRAGERGDLDAFLILGDTVYADGAQNLEEYRAKWAHTFSTGEYQALRASTALIGTWDDHEVDNGWGGDNVTAEQLAAARQAFFEHMPGRTPNGAQVVWRSVRFGDTAEVFVLDSRSERDQAAGDYLSPAQMAWLKGALQQSTATFKLVMSSVPIASYDVPFFSPFADDRWEGFPRSRDEILGHIDELGIGGVLWLAGDFHLACAGRVSLEGPGSSARELLVGPGAQLANISPSFPSGPQFDWASGVNNYAELELDPERGTVRARWLDGRGKVIKELDV
ncbi:MAG: alkaline phosphatase D family protein [Myxococcaceae bacterium]|nr:alkaline phosphatase D family protein [Myxococcaceae bacterium]